MFPTYFFLTILFKFWHRYTYFSDLVVLLFVGNTKLGAGKKKRLDYPFSKTMLYIHFLIGVFSMVFSLSLLCSVSESPFFSISLYFVLVSIVIVLSFRLKIYTIKKILISENKLTFNQQPRRGLIDRNLIFLFMLTLVAFSSPFVISFFLGSFVALLYLTVYVVGFSLSEPVVYFYCEKWF